MEFGMKNTGIAAHSGIFPEQKFGIGDFGIWNEKQR
jgi:hypothetical protein